ncbi:MAG: hypothetical protein Q8Q85_09830 [Gemmatimonadales bacterium]|nr:hypothetical protein [Gemmatimonadales bacterium]
MPLSRRTLLVAALVAGAARAEAQSRPVEQLASTRPEVQLMGYYAAVMHFAPVGFAGRGSRWEIGGDITYLPNLSAEDQQVGFNGTKAEDTNFCPVFPRLRAARVTGEWAVDVAYLPAVRVCGVKPHMVSAAVTRRFGASSTWGGALRASAHYGTLIAAITCSKDAVADPTNTICLGGQVSDDQYRPFTLALEGALTYGGWAARRIEPYALFGLRRDDPRFDVRFINVADSLDDRRLTLEQALFRLHVAAGAAWSPSSRVRFGGEVFYAPRALLTVRSRASIALGGGS